MSYFLNPVEEQACVFLTCEGVLPEVQTTAVRKALCAMLAWKQWGRLVVDLTAMQSAPPEELCAMGKSLLQDVPKRARVAVIVRRDQTVCARLLEKVARHVGVFLTFFVDVEKAEAWVQNDTPKRNPALTHCSGVDAHQGSGSRKGRPDSRSNSPIKGIRHAPVATHPWERCAGIGPGQLGGMRGEEPTRQMHPA